MTVETVEHDGGPALEVVLDQRTLLRDLSALRTNLPGILLSGHGTVTVDVAAVERLSSVTVAALLRVKRLCLMHGVEMRVANPSSRNRSVMRRCGMVETERTRPGGGAR
ncbi:lipid asymmetry maintenance protein MlaB [Humibacillus xanthopallidus]|uniref:STAS domain-containing protein n=1 Tax=Humibacillus xanthopallidus TaxID=412689 RepID=UPI00385152F5